MLNWSDILIYFCAPFMFEYLYILIYTGMMVIQIVFFHFVHILTKLKETERFSPFYYILPLLICAALFLSPFSESFNIKLSIVHDRNTILSGYGGYTFIFTSRIIICFILANFYTLLSIYRLFRYSHIISVSNKITKPLPPRLIVITIVLLLISTIPLLIPIFPQYIYFSIPLTGLILIAQHIILIYNIMNKKHLLFMLNEEENIENEMKNSDVSIEYMNNETGQEPKLQGEDFKGENTSDRIETLNQEQFEAYFKRQKPYLNPQFKITDLIGPFNVNRSYISAFINKTYNMNFSRYVNISRLKELEMLLQLAENKEKNAIELTEKAGFGSYRNYLRTKRNEEVINKRK